MQKGTIFSQKAEFRMIEKNLNILPHESKNQHLVLKVEAVAEKKVDNISWYTGNRYCYLIRFDASP